MQPKLSQGTIFSKNILSVRSWLEKALNVRTYVEHSTATVTNCKGTATTSVYVV
uniref:Uncharacterized protein n=1 Tax=Anguilla anguilla TaxID=7936 RepID=A0A0E9RQY4_ANGAN